MIHISDHGVNSLWTAEPAALAERMVKRGWKACRLQTPAQHAYLRHGRRVVVVFNNGTVLLQGLEIEDTRAMVKRIAALPPEQQQSLGGLEW
jgi:hypothetical protein